MGWPESLAVCVVSICIAAFFIAEEVKMFPNEKEFNRRIGFFETSIEQKKDIIKKSGCNIL